MLHDEKRVIDKRNSRQMIRRLVNDMNLETVFVAKNRWLWLSPVTAVFYCQSESIN